MPPARFSISATGAKEYRELAVKLKKAGRKDLRAKLREKIKAAGNPVLDEAKSAARSVPVTGSRGGGTKQRRGFNISTASTARKASAGRRKAGLRNSIAAAMRLQITAKGVRFVVNSDRLPVSQRRLPRHLDNPKGWRHPVFGDMEEWAHQQGRPYFAVTIKRRAPQFRQAVLTAMEEIRRELEK